VERMGGDWLAAQEMDASEAAVTVANWRLQ
jgi:hypothetical protein